MKEAIPSQEEDHYWMKEALQEAKHAFEEDEVPIGAVLVKEGRIIARAHNQVEHLNTATAHAELLCLVSAGKQLDNWRLLGTTLYTTVEPCAMCAGALLLSRVSRLVWGAPDLRHGAHGSWINLFENTHPTHQMVLHSGVLAEESAHLLRQFFRQKREKKETKIPSAAVSREHTILLLEEMIKQQKAQLLKCAQRLIPHVTFDDLLQPNDYPLLETHPEVRYEEGVLAGMQAIQMALFAFWRREGTKRACFQTGCSNGNCSDEEGMAMS